MRRQTTLWIFILAALAGCVSGDDLDSVANTPPDVCLTVSPASGLLETAFQVSASCSTDEQDATTALQVRWDWESDGNWDTELSTTKTAQHQYESDGPKIITVEVQDTGGLTARATRSVMVGEIPQLPPGLIRIAAGDFLMGSPLDEPGRDSGEIAHPVTLTRSFELCDHEVTQAEWDSIMGWNDARSKGPELPVETVTWFDCLRYCNLRSIKEGLDSVYVMASPRFSGVHITAADSVVCDWTKNGYRLPSEAEWEYACRAGSVTAFCAGAIAELYCGANPNLTDVGWFCGNSRSRVHSVKSRQANAWDLYDMHGNVWEWCWDSYAPYDTVATDPTGPASGSRRVTRGGGWFNDARLCRSATRGDGDPAFGSYHLGVRIARTVD